jgi:hypothetical protein
MRPFFYLFFSICLLSVELVSTAALAQGKSTATTPLEWVRNTRASVPASASFYYDISFYDDNRQLITDTLIADTDAKRIRCVRRDKITRAPVGMTWAIYWPSLRKSAEGRVAIINGVERQVGRWVFWYDHSPQASNVEREIIYDVQGKVVLNSEKQYAEKRVGCNSIVEDALPSGQNKLTCHSCFGSSRTMVPVRLHAGASGIIVKMDIRDGKASPVTFTNVEKAVVAYAEGGAPKATASVIAAWLTSENQPSVGTNSYYFITTDGVAAQKWYASKGTVYPSPATVIYKSLDNPNSEMRLIELPKYMNQVFVCVENTNVYTDATLTLAVKDLRQECE